MVERGCGGETPGVSHASGWPGCKEMHNMVHFFTLWTPKLFFEHIKKNAFNG